MFSTQLLRWNIGAVAALLVLSAAGSSGRAQELYGSVVGTVQDGSGARIPGATVEIVNRATNLTITAVSNETGSYTFTNVLSGTYDVKVTLQGFKEFKQPQVPVTAGAISRVDAKLEVGAMTDTVTVRSEAVLLKTDKADTASAFTDKEIVDLPLPDFRNYQSLLDLVPGSTPSDFQNAEIDTPARALTTNINGTNRNTNSTRVDGATNQFTWLPHHTLYVAPAETIASVNVTTGSFSADQGLAGGAAVTVITKSGTNHLQGSGFAFYTDQNLRARTYFAKRQNTPKSPTNHHIDGGTLGGPILRNKLFFFGAFEGQYRNTEGENIYTVPTAKMRAGDFTEALNTNGSLQLIYDPLTGDIDGRGRTAFPGNIIPADRLNATAQRINQFYPLPNRPGTSDNYFKEYLSTFDRNQYDVKINWNRSGGHQVWGKIGIMDATVSNLQKLSFDGGGLGKTLTWVATVGQTFTPSPSLVIDTTVGYSLLDQWGYGPDYGKNWGLELGVPGTNGPDIRQSGMPWFGNGMSAQGSTDAWNPYTRFDPTYTAAANITKLAGAHTFRFGGAIDRQAMNHWQPEFGGAGPRGRVDSSGNLAALRGGSQGPNFYNQYAAFMLGLTSSVSKAIQWEEMTTREWRYGFYVGDRWQPHRDITLDLGLRYEYFPLVNREGDRGVERLDVATMQVLLGGVGDVPRNVGLKTSKADFAPRVGIAWRVSDRTVLRSGYGLTYNPLPFARPLRGAYPLTINNTYVSLNSWQPYGTLERGIPEFTGPGPTEGHVPLPSTASMRTPDPDNVGRGYIQSWNASFERRLPWDMSVNAAYVGSKTTRGFANIELNVSPPGGGEAGRVFFPRTASTTLFGGWNTARYHSMQLQLSRPFKNGLLLRGAYTLSKAMNMTDDDGTAGFDYNAPDVFYRNYAAAGYDRRHTFTTAFTYQLPFGVDGRGNLLNEIIRGWQINGLIAAYSGTPFSITASNSALDQRGNLQTADQVGDVVRRGVGPDEFFYDPTAWANILDRRYGNSGRNQYYGPGYYNINMSLFRTFQLHG
ncbi:MAG TPA: TonB-dependent receptor, partial [Vicinamibacterales bacterium]